jgi:Na+/melibiose symporter-like transporter
LRPIVWGFILTVVGGILWVMFSFVGAIGELATGEKDVLMLALVYLYFILFFFSFPVAIVIEVVNWVRRKRIKQVQATAKAEAKEVAVPFMLSIAKPKYCMQCGVELNPLGETGKMMCPKCDRIYG